MIKVYMAVGNCVLHKQGKYLYPVIYYNQKEYEMTVHEFQIWSRAVHNVMSAFELKTFFDSSDFSEQENSRLFEETMNRLEQRGLLISAEGLNVTDAFYSLIKEWYVVPIPYTLVMRIKDFLIQTFQFHIPIQMTIKLLLRRKFVTSERFLLEYIGGQKCLKTSDLIKGLEQLYYQGKQGYIFTDSHFVGSIRIKIVLNILFLYKNGAIRFEAA